MGCPSHGRQVSPRTTNPGVLYATHRVGCEREVKLRRDPSLSPKGLKWALAVEMSTADPAPSVLAVPLATDVVNQPQRQRSFPLTSPRHSALPNVPS